MRLEGGLWGLEQMGVLSVGKVGGLLLVWCRVCESCCGIEPDVGSATIHRGIKFKA